MIRDDDRAPGWWSFVIDTPWAQDLALWTPESPPDPLPDGSPPPRSGICGCAAPTGSAGLGAALLLGPALVQRRTRATSGSGPR